MARKKVKKKCSSYLKNNIDYLQFLSRLSSQKQKKLIKGMDKNIIYALSELALNILKRTISLSETHKSKLRPFSYQIRQLALKKHSMKKKKNILSQKGAGLITTLLGTVLPIILSNFISK